MIVDRIGDYYFPLSVVIAENPRQHDMP